MVERCHREVEEQPVEAQIMVRTHSFARILRRGEHVDDVEICVVRHESVVGGHVLPPQADDAVIAQSEVHRSVGLWLPGSQRVVVGDGLATPGTPHNRHLVVEVASALIEVDLGSGVIAFACSHANADDEPIASRMGALLANCLASMADGYSGANKILVTHARPVLAAAARASATTESRLVDEAVDGSQRFEPTLLGAAYPLRNERSRDIGDIVGEADSDLHHTPFAFRELVVDMWLVHGCFVRSSWLAGEPRFA